MHFIADEFIDRLIKEDVPYFDLTTHVLGIGSRQGRISFTARESTVISGIDEVLKIFSKLNIKVLDFKPSGTVLKPGETFVEAEGSAESLHMAWKVSLNILEYCSGISTRTRILADKAKAINPKVEIVTTRKVFPGTKELAVSAVTAGGGLPHRLGLSETILIFKQHLAFYGDVDTLAKNLNQIKARAIEKKVIVETESREEALILCKAGADAIQFDKIKPAVLKNIVQELRKINAGVVLIGTGGITDENVEEYAEAGVDVISTTWVYFGKPADISVAMKETQTW
ncbi:MAG: ModD protein [Clostridiales bacterium]|nr:ModD protein [Clostridiales bacterium]